MGSFKEARNECEQALKIDKNEDVIELLSKIPWIHEHWTFKWCFGVKAVNVWQKYHIIDKMLSFKKWYLNIFSKYV